MPIKVLIADDHEVVREGLRLILEAQEGIWVAGQAGNGREAVKQAKALLPDVLLMDISMAELNGIEATSNLRDSLPSVKVIMLSMHNSTEFVSRAMQAGAQGYIIKESAGIELHKAIRAVMKGEKFIGQGIEIVPTGVPLISGETGQCALGSLSPRERETLQLVAEGKTNTTIAELLHISPQSVVTYRRRLMLRLGLNNVPALVMYAIRHGVISLQ